MIPLSTLQQIIRDVPRYDINHCRGDNVTGECDYYDCPSLGAKPCPLPWHRPGSPCDCRDIAIASAIHQSLQAESSASVSVAQAKEAEAFAAGWRMATEVDDKGREVWNDFRQAQTKYLAQVRAEAVPAVSEGQNEHEKDHARLATASASDTTADLRGELPESLLHLMECRACHRFGVPIRADDTICGNCGSTETHMWFRERAVALRRAAAIGDPHGAETEPRPTFTLADVRYSFNAGWLRGREDAASHWYEPDREKHRDGFISATFGRVSDAASGEKEPSDGHQSPDHRPDCRNDLSAGSRGADLPRHPVEDASTATQRAEKAEAALAELEQRHANFKENEARVREHYLGQLQQVTAERDALRAQLQELHEHAAGDAWERDTK